MSLMSLSHCRLVFPLMSTICAFLDIIRGRSLDLVASVVPYRRPSEDH